MASALLFCLLVFQCTFQTSSQFSDAHLCGGGGRAIERGGVAAGGLRADTVIRPSSVSHIHPGRRPSDSNATLRQHYPPSSTTCTSASRKTEARRRTRACTRTHTRQVSVQIVCAASENAQVDLSHLCLPFKYNQRGKKWGKKTFFK